MLKLLTFFIFILNNGICTQKKDKLFIFNETYKNLIIEIKDSQKILISDLILRPNELKEVFIESHDKKLIFNISSTIWVPTSIVFKNNIKFGGLIKIYEDSPITYSADNLGILNIEYIENYKNKRENNDISTTIYY